MAVAAPVRARRAALVGSTGGKHHPSASPASTAPLSSRLLRCSPPKSPTPPPDTTASLSRSSDRPTLPAPSAHARPPLLALALGLPPLAPLLLPLRPLPPLLSRLSFSPHPFNIPLFFFFFFLPSLPPSLAIIQHHPLSPASSCIVFGCFLLILYYSWWFISHFASRFLPSRSACGWIPPPFLDRHSPPCCSNLPPPKE